jgi:hypothetical protein
MPGKRLDMNMLESGLISMACSKVRRVLGLNILRVLEDVDAYASKQQETNECTRATDHVATVWTDAQRDLLMRQGRERGLKKWVLS